MSEPYKLPPPPLSFKRMKKRARLRVFGMTLSFCVISLIAACYSLGYKINWVSHSITQTGIVSITTNATTLRPAVYLDGVQIGNSLPVKQTFVFPGEYTLTVKQDGYQTWQHLITVRENRVTAFKNFLMLEENPKAVAVNSHASFPTDGSLTQNIAVKDDFELWANGQYITRFSQELVAVSWYPDRSHIVCQVGKQLIFFDRDSGITQTIATLASADPVQIGFEQGGRLLFYHQTGNPIKALELF